MDSSNKIWAFFLNLGCNMWEDKWSPKHKHPIQVDTSTRYYEITSTEKDTWKRIVDDLPSFGINMVVIDLGEGVRYDTHPELANEGSWTKEELMAEIRRMKLMGLEPIPKLNFSACHDAWLGEYGYMVSTKKYYEVVSDLIAEVCEMFEHPRFFHLGMDEEDYPDHHTGITSIRSVDLWWHDLYFFFNEVEKHGARPWIWSDFYWKHQEGWEKKMPKDDEIEIIRASADPLIKTLRVDGKSLDFKLGKNALVYFELNRATIQGDRGYDYDRVAMGENAWEENNS